MMPAKDAAPDALDDAIMAVRLLAIDPAGLGGLLLSEGDVVRDDVLAALATALPAGAPIRRMPANIDDERLLGGIDLGATLSQGTPVWRSGLLAEIDGGALIVPMAERLGEATAARIAGVLDSGDVPTDRGGETEPAPARFCVVAFDDGRDDDDAVPLVLSERLAFRVNLADIRPRSVSDIRPTGPGAVEPASHAVVEAIATTAAMLGIDSMRASIFALRAARASAMLAGRSEIAEADVALAARLVLGPRATRLPHPDEAPPKEEDALPPPPPPPENDGEERADPLTEQPPMDDVVLAAAMASLPKGLLADIARGGQRRGPASKGRGKGERRKSPTRGRPVGVRAGVPRGGLRLSLIDTLRAAAPWQKIRMTTDEDGRRVRIRRDDLRIRRFESRTEATTIFAVDASGSSALARLAEAKGAVELLLGEAYVKRAQVALVAVPRQRQWHRFEVVI